MSARELHRREFLQLLGAGSLVIVAGPNGVRRIDPAAGGLPAAAEGWSPAVYVSVAEDGVVTLICHRSEMGQGIRTTMPMIIADEMEADWAKCRVAQADGDEKYGSQNTDGSTSIRDFLSKYREAGATVRALLEDAAAKEWGVSPTTVRARQHEVVHEPTGRTRAFGALVATARSLPVPGPERVRIKQPDERRWEGKRMTSIDLGPVTAGTARYGADVILPGMKTAVIARPPVWGGTVVSVDDRAALAVPGVERVVRVPGAPLPGGFLPLGGVAVVARNTWAAIRGRDALRITWDHGAANAGYESGAYRASLQEAVRQPGRAGRTHGNATEALASASRRIVGEYYVPHLSHAQMEPVAAVAQVRDGAVEAWAPTQSPLDARKTIAEYLGLDVAQVTVHVTLLGGAFGRKSKPDFVCEAAWLAREVGAPVRVQWTREDDLRNSYYHSAAAHRLEAGLDAQGTVTAWTHRAAYPAIMATFVPGVTGAEPDELTNGASDIPFDVPNMSIEICPAVAHARIGWFRSVNAIHHGFAIGSFVDELAHATGNDPVAFLLALIGSDRQVDLSAAGLVAPASNYGATWADYPLDTARVRRVVQLAAERSGWGAPLPRGRGRGVAVHRSFLSCVATVVEVEVRPDGTVLVPRATVAVDAGFVANPDRVRSQLEGALIMAMSNVLYGAITFADGRVVQSNYHDYQVTRMRAAPHAVDVHIVESERLPGGIGEPGVPPSGAALANAIFSATGVRVRELPVGSQLAGWTTGATGGGDR